MLTTKLARKVLSKANQQHLTDNLINSMEKFEDARKHQKKIEGLSCHQCEHIERKLKEAKEIE